ncbi:hypothetical protein [Dactylosporangium sp. CA-139066]|uniref:aromatic-ring hydroxylase C-terminal domain-containing protein n=1 Tax=Dactylosporangium sp. CA-139066 TaxID=3239930 RepID=UPI003D905D69
MKQALAPPTAPRRRRRGRAGPRGRPPPPRGPPRRRPGGRRPGGGWQGYERPGEHPLTGRLGPDLELSDGTRLAERLHGGRALLLNPKADGYEDRLDQATAGGAARMLVRPDGYVAWAGDTEDEEPDLAP